MSSLDERPLPTPALVGAGLLVLTTIVGVGAIQLTKHFAPPHQATATETAIDTRDLRFVDQGDGVNAYGGHVRVYDAVTGNELPPLRESDGFIRAVLNSLNFERTKRNMDAPPVFQLIRWSGDKITLEDRATGARVNIGAFGNGNRAVFLRFFEQARETP